MLNPKQHQSSSLLSPKLASKETVSLATVCEEIAAQDVFAHSPVASVVLSKAGAIQLLNRAFCRFLGYEAQALLNRPFSTLIEPAQRDHWRAFQDADNRHPLALAYQHRQAECVWGLTNVFKFIDANGLVLGSIVQLQDISPHKQREELLELRAAAGEATTEGIIISDALAPGFPIIYASRAFCDFTGYRQEEILGRNCRFLQGPETDPQTVATIRQALSSYGSFAGEIRNYRKNGEPFWNFLRMEPLRDEHGQVRYIVGTQTDVSERKRTEETLRQYEEIFASASDMMALVIDNYTYQSVNQRYLEVFEKPREAIVGHSVAELHGEDFFKTIKPAYDRCFAGFEVRTQHWITPPASDPLYLDIKIIPYRDRSGNVAGAVVSTRDITELHRAQTHIHHLAYFDTLTQLPNRICFQEQLQQRFELIQQQGQRFAVLFLDLDNFKRINDTLGHRVGDLLLQQVANRLRASLRSVDRISRPTLNMDEHRVARLGGDEFVILLTDIAQTGAAAQVARRILEALTQPFCVDDHSIFASASIGISVYPRDGADIEDLFKNAEIAMYHSKKFGKNGFQFYDESMQALAVKRLNLENELRKALERDEFYLHYQAQMDLASNTIVGVEALLRWHNPKLGRVSPADFIASAEETGLIVPIGAWVLETACAQAMAWQKQGLSKLRMAVNLSARQFAQPDLPALLTQVLQRTGFDGGCLELELTESLLMQDIEHAIHTMGTFKAMGVTLAIDDFGTGYSSLSYLKRFPLDRLKIDRSFIQDIHIDPNNAAITLAVISMAHSLGLEVIAEGVETDAQRVFLQQHRCDEIQGYYLSPPLSAEALAMLLRRHGDVVETT